jgi:enamine deaminase RidA (YjgF/YER057c/UK114 family)
MTDQFPFEPPARIDRCATALVQSSHIECRCACIIVKRRHVDGSGEVSLPSELTRGTQNDQSVALAVEMVLQVAGNGLADLVRLNYHTTDIGAFFANYRVLMARLTAHDSPPSGTLLGVERLARPEYLIEIEGTAAR